VGEIKVTIYERVKLDNKWTRVGVEIPEGRKRDGRPFLKGDRQGKFQLSWYEKRRKKWQDVTKPNHEQQLSTIRNQSCTTALRMARIFSASPKSDEPDSCWYFAAPECLAMLTVS
jgi:hypothetical protein